MTLVLVFLGMVAAIAGSVAAVFGPLWLKDDDEPYPWDL